MPSPGLTEIFVLTMIIAQIAITVAVIWLIIRAITGRRRDPARVLDERLARGEITAEEFQEARRILGDQDV